MMKQAQRGFYLVMAVIFIMVIGLIATVTTYLFSTRNAVTVAELNGLRTFYLAESALEIGKRLLTTPFINASNPTRSSCSGLSNLAIVNNAPLLNGSFSLKAVNNLPFRANTTLSGSISATAMSIPVNNVAGFAPAGRVIIEREAIDYSRIVNNNLIVAKRGAGGTLPSLHAPGAGVGHYICLLDAKASLPNAQNPSYQREIQLPIPLQEAWAVGDTSSSNYYLLRMNAPTELSVTNYSLSGSANLNSISMLSNADGWAVGNASGFSHTILRWNGTAWQMQSAPAACLNQRLTSIYMVSNQEGWAVGSSYNILCLGLIYRYLVLYYNGSSWSYLNSTTSPSIPSDSSLLINQNLNGIYMLDVDGDGRAEFGFAVGSSGAILRYNGSSWTKLTTPTSQTLNGVYIVSTGEAWAVGNGGVILRWNGSSWTTYPSPTTGVLNAIYMIDTDGDGIANIGWVVGNGGILLTYNGVNFSNASIQSTNLNSIAGFNPDDVWVAGDSGRMLHWDGIRWNIFNMPSSQNINSIAMIGSTTGLGSGWQQIF